jgi:signal transduction histidine kinase
MRSRAVALSAEFFLDSYPGHGTTIIIEMPYTKEIEYLHVGEA